MQKSTFIYEVKQRIADKSPEALRKLLIELSQYVPRSDYEDVLALLEKRDEIPAAASNTDLLSAVRELCDSVDNGEYDFSWDLEDGYGYGGYWDDDTLTDCDGLGEQVESLLKTSMAYVRDKRYAEALQAFD